MRFYPGQKDYLDRLNELPTVADLATTVQASTDQAAAAATAKAAAEAAAAAATAVVTNVSVVRHSLRPSLLLAFGALKQLDPRITFTRASKACRWNSKGLVEVVDANKPRFDHDPVTGECKGLLIEEARPNLLLYPRNFDSAAWNKFAMTVVPNVTLAPDGAMTADAIVETTAVTKYLTQAAAVVQGGVYTLSCFAKKGTGGRNFALAMTGGISTNQVALFDLTNGGITITSGAPVCTCTHVGNGWYRCTMTATADAGTSLAIQVRPSIGTITYPGDGSSYIYVWHAQVEAGSFATSVIPDGTTFTSRASNKWEFNSAGVLTQYANDVAVTAYDPVTLVSKGLSLEASATNGVRNNTMQGAVVGVPGTAPTNWAGLTSGLDGLSRDIVAVGTEDGIDYVDIRFYGTTTTATTRNISFESATTATATSGQTWVGSFYLALTAGSLANLTNVRIQTVERDSGGTQLAVSEQAIALTSGALRTKRYQVSRTLDQATTAAAHHKLVFTYALGAVVDITIRFGLPQLEQGSVATSPIKTTGTAVTRASDVSSSPQVTRAAEAASMPASLQWYNSAEGTLYAEFDAPVPASRSDSAVIAGFDDGTANNRFAPFYTSNTKAISANLVSGGAQQYQITAAGVADLAAGHRVAFGYKSGDNALAADGVAPATTANATAIPAVNTLRFGIRPGGTQANLHIKRIAYYPKRLSNAEVQAITA